MEIIWQDLFLFLHLIKIILQKNHHLSLRHTLYVALKKSTVKERHNKWKVWAVDECETWVLSPLVQIAQFY